MSPTSANTPGAELGRYRLEQRIARGGMGEVFRALAMGADGFSKRVVVKRILPDLADNDALVSMFSLEAKLMTRLEHPNIVQVLDFGVGEQREYFLVMELVEGVDLGRFRRIARSRQRLLPVPLVMFIILQMLRGLGHAHKSRPEGHLLVHRDVSPSNVLLSRLGEVKVADFGVALVARAEHTSAGGVVGKPNYMAPEQYRGEAIDPRADLFSAGVVLYEALTHQLPFAGDTIQERQQCAAVGDMRAPSELRDGLPAGLDDVLRRALAPNRDDRYPDARAMARALREVTGELSDADDLADAVNDAIEHAPPKLVPVVALGLDAPKAEDIANTRQEPAAHVTRVATIGGFTLEVSESLGELSAVPLTQTAVDPRLDAPTRIERRSLTLPLALVLVAAAGASAFFLTRPPEPLALEPSPTLAPALDLPQPDATAEPEASSVASGDVSAQPRPGAAPAAAPSVTAAASAVVSTPPPADCFGQVSLFSTSSWQVSGGPSVVQSPGRYRWPCGTYHLNATSRMDSSQRRSTTIVLREGGGAVFDLR